MTSPSFTPAIAPYHAMSAHDVAHAAARIDQWLRGMSGVGLGEAAGLIPPSPVLGNSMALSDTVADLLSLSLMPPEPQDWSRFAANLIGLYPGALAGGRISLRVTLHYLRARLSVAGAPLTDAHLEALAAHVNSTHAGELDDLADDASAALSGFLAAAVGLGQQLATGLAEALERLAAGGRPSAPAMDSVPALLCDPKTAIAAPWRELYRFSLAANRQAESSSSSSSSSASPAPTSSSASSPGVAAQALRAFAAQIPGKISAQSGGADSLGELLNQLRAATKPWREKKERNGVIGNVAASGGDRVQKGYPGSLLGALGDHVPAEDACNACKNGTAAGSGGSIGFALGDETLMHPDFTLPGPVPFSWVRTYNSRLSAYDRGPLGARWITPWTVRIDIDAAALTYHGADGRSFRCPRIPLGEQYSHPVEGFTLTPVDPQLLTLTRGPATPGSLGKDAPFIETFQRVPAAVGVPEHYRLVAQRRRDGLLIGLAYRRRSADGREVLTDLTVRHGATLLHHLATRNDTTGRLRELWLVKDGQLVRQLAAYTYSPLDRQGESDLIAAADEAGRARTYQYRRHLITRYADKTGRGMNLEWDGDSPRAKAVREVADDGSFDTRLSWDQRQRRVTVTDAEGGKTEHHYDRQGYTCRLIHPDGREEWFFRDGRKNLIRRQHANGSDDRFAWDERDNLVSRTAADGGTVHFEIDDQDRRTGVQDPMGGIWRYGYDGKGNLVEATGPLGFVTEVAYNGFNQPVEITDARGGKKQLAYTASGQLQSLTDCSGKTAAWTYDERGRTKTVTDSAGTRTEHHYGEIPPPRSGKADDADQIERERHARRQQNAGFLEKIVHPDGGSERFLHDAEGRLLEHTDAAGKKTEWTYTAAGLVHTRRDARGHTLTYRWDKLGRLTALINANGAEARFHYGPGGKLLRQTGFDGQTIRYGYDKQSGVLSTLDHGNARQIVLLDPLGRITERRSQTCREDGQWIEAEREEYIWDRNGRLLEARNPVSRLSWIYDKAGHVTFEHQHYHPNGPGTPGLTAVWRHAYDPLGNRIATLRPDGHRLQHLTYGSGHVHGILLDGEALAAFERDDLHREIERTLKNGLIQTRSFDPLGRLKEQTLLSLPSPASAGEGRGRGHNGQLLNRAYHYDRAGQLSKIDDSGKGQTDYRYDPAGRLLEAVTPLGTERFAFDPAGNLLDAQEDRHAGTQKPPLLNNLLKKYAGTFYQHDARGNLIEKHKNGETVRYRWNALDRLVEVETAQVRTTFLYDPLGRRIQKKSEALVRELLPEAGSQYRESEKKRIAKAQNLGTTYYGWEGDRLAWETKDEETVHYLYEPGSFIPIAQAVSGSGMKLHKTPDWKGRDYNIKDDPLWTETFAPEPFKAIGFYHCDRIGTPQEITDEAGNIVWSAKYKAWGEASETAANGFKNPLRFQGQYFDHETGLHYNRHRYYDPETGRFLSKDPIGFQGGLNLHAYAPNPVSWVDPLGLAGCACDPAAIAQAARDRVKQGNWGRSGLRGILEAMPPKRNVWWGKYKCNLFVNWVTQEGNSSSPEVDEDYTGKIPWRPAVAPELADPDKRIDFWEVIPGNTDLRDGDIIAGKGHTGIVVFQENGDPGSISASSETGKIEWNDWGFRDNPKSNDPKADSTMTIRRCVCPWEQKK